MRPRERVRSPVRPRSLRASASEKATSGPASAFLSTLTHPAPGSWQPGVPSSAVQFGGGACWSDGARGGPFVAVAAVAASSARVRHGRSAVSQFDGSLPATMAVPILPSTAPTMRGRLSARGASSPSAVT